MNTKQLSRVEIKDADKGEVEAVFATFDVVDHDGDVTVKGAFEVGAPVIISSYGHSTTTKGALPVGMGTIRETSTEAVMDGRFFLDTQPGHDTFTVVKELSAPGGPGQEWSYHYEAIKKRNGTFDGKRVRFLEQQKVFHVSPVERGAGIDTRTLSLKGIKELPGGRTVNELRQLLRDALDEAIDMPADNAWLYVADFTDEWVVYEQEGSGWAAPGTYQRDYTVADDGTVTFSDEVEVEARREYVAKDTGPAGVKFSEQVVAAVAAVSAALTRGEEVITFRTAQGKSRLSDVSVDTLGRLDAELKRLDALLRTSSTPLSEDEVEREFVRFVALTQGAPL